MIDPIRTRRMMYQIVLASNSPRRQELLKGLDIPFTVRVKEDISEDYPHDLPVDQIPRFIAKKKAAAYDIGDNELLITADTVVVLDREVMGKPHNASDAKRMLRALSGYTHQVVTGVCLTTRQRQRAFTTVTDVTFKELSDEEIDYYVTHYHPFDKAGAYGVQEWIGYIGVTKLQGGYFNVMGLPVQRIYQELKRF